MAQEVLRRYTCDECKREVIMEGRPIGWLRFNVQDRSAWTIELREVGLSRGRHMEITRDNWWCRIECLVRWIGTKVGA